MNVYMSEDLRELYTTGYCNRYKAVSKNQRLLLGFFSAVEFLLAASNTSDLASVSKFHYEKLKYQYSGLSSIRLANGFVHRLLFREDEEGLEVLLIEIDDTHYGNKK